jgi:hypothetical protein
MLRLARRFGLLVTILGFVAPRANAGFGPDRYESLKKWGAGLVLGLLVGILLLLWGGWRRRHPGARPSPGRIALQLAGLGLIACALAPLTGSWLGEPVRALEGSGSAMASADLETFAPCGGNWVDGSPPDYRRALYAAAFVVCGIGLVVLGTRRPGRRSILERSS